MFALSTVIDAFVESVDQFRVSMIMNSSVSRVSSHCAPRPPLLKVKLAPESQSIAEKINEPKAMPTRNNPQSQSGRTPEVSPEIIKLVYDFPFLVSGKYRSVTTSPKSGDAPNYPITAISPNYPRARGTRCDTVSWHAGMTRRGGSTRISKLGTIIQLLHKVPSSAHAAVCAQDGSASQRRTR
jgi:hypothetical protein